MTTWLTRGWRCGKRHIQTIRLLTNWWEVCAAGCRRQPVTRLIFRNGVVLEGPSEAHLDYLFHDIWIAHAYDCSTARIRDGDTVVDIGANIGVFSLYAATRAAQVRVYAYEPARDAAMWLRRNVARSNLTNIAVFEQAVSNTSGPRFLSTCDGNWMLNHLSAEEPADACGAEVVSVCLDDVFLSNAISRCDVLKLDCEGSEYDILEAASSTVMKRIRRIVGEYHRLHQGDDAATRLRELLHARGFVIERMSGVDDTAGLCGLFSARRRNER